MVATSHPLASSTAVAALRDGGNAIDAAIATAAVLNVVEPTMTGIGGDMFALVLMRGETVPVGLDGSGWSGSRATLDAVGAAGLTPIQTVTVPGAVAGWFRLHDRYGTLPMPGLLEPAIGYAENGFPVSEIVAGQWRRVEPELRERGVLPDPYFPKGRPVDHGELFRNPGLARSLALLASDGRDAFYGGPIGAAILETSERLGGFLTRSDLEAFDAEWVEPISTVYRGHRAWEMPPNTQGVTVLEMLNILEGFDLAGMGHHSAAYAHALIEAKKLAFADRDRFIADPRRVEVPTATLLSPEYASSRRKRIDASRAASEVAPGPIPAAGSGDTVYFTVVDGRGNVVSFINSLFASFGSGIVAQDTGICLHNRGFGFVLDPDHPNAMAPRKRPMHTLIPAMVTVEDRPWLSFGVMGGHMQAPGHVQVLVNMIDFGMDVQAAGEAPRIRHDAGCVALESAFPQEVREQLAARGHRLVDGFGGFGGSQGIRIEAETGVLAGGSDPRKDGLALGF
jgi:gamma-glutamyltranspeptidase/glutathione hydrolase